MPKLEVHLLFAGAQVSNTQKGDLKFRRAFDKGITIK